MKKYLVPGLILILAGVYFLIEALPGVSLPFGAFFMLIGAVLLVGRLCSRGKYGLSIAGFIALCLGSAWVLLDVLHIGGQYVMVATPLALSLAFFLTHICEYRRIGNWPMVPALVLLAFAVLFFLMLTPEVNAILKPYYGTILPLILILIGVSLLLRGVKDRKLEKNVGYEAPLRHAVPQNNEPVPEDTSTWAQPPLYTQSAQPKPSAEPQKPTPSDPINLTPPPAQPMDEDFVTVMPESVVGEDIPDHAQACVDESASEKKAE